MEANTMFESIVIPLISAVVGGIVGYLLSYRLLNKEIKANRRIAGAELLLAIDNRLHNFDRIHQSLRGGGDWLANQSNPPGDIHWSEVDAYMGLFERLNVFIDDGLIDVEWAKTFYEYRVSNLVMNEGIREHKLKEEANDWIKFDELCKKLKVQTPE